MIVLLESSPYSFTSNANKVIVLERKKGKTSVKEVGTHKELMRKDITYKDLIRNN